MKVACFLAVAMLAQPAIAAPADDEREVRKVEAALCDALRTGNAAAIAKLEDETYTLTNSKSEVTTRADDIADAKKGVRLYADAAIVLGVTSVKGTSGEKPFAADFQFTDTYVRRGDGWKIAASHATRIEKK